MRVIILAAGQGQRLRPHTLNQPKALVHLLGRPLLAYQLDALHSAGLHDITLVTGYRAESFSNLDLPTRYNPRHATTNMVASLMCAADLLDGGDDCIVAYADIVYEPRVLTTLLATPSSAHVTTVIDRNWRKLWDTRMPDPLSDAETLQLNDANEILELGHRAERYADIDGQFIGLTRISAQAARGWVETWRSLDSNCSYAGQPPATIDLTTFLRFLIANNWTIQACPVEGGWLEVDSTADLDVYHELALNNRLQDFCRLPGRQVESLK